MSRAFRAYQFVIECVADWEFLAEVAGRIHSDRRLSRREKENLFDLIDRAEWAVRPTFVQMGGVPWKPVIANT